MEVIEDRIDPMGRGLGETQRLLLRYFEDNPQCLISTEVLLW